MAPETRTIYFGPPKGMYESNFFHDFARIDIGRKLNQIGSPSECNVEDHDNGTTYHFPTAGMGINYTIINVDRCRVNLMGTRTDVLDDISAFFFEKDNE